MVFTVFTICITVAEAAMGLAIVILLFRIRRTVMADHLDLLKGDGRRRLLALVALLPPVAVVPGARDRGASSAPRTAGCLLLDLRRSRVACGGLARHGARTAARAARLVWEWLPSEGRPLATIGVLADETPR